MIILEVGKTYYWQDGDSTGRKRFMMYTVLIRKLNDFIVEVHSGRRHFLTKAIDDAIDDNIRSFGKGSYFHEYSIEVTDKNRKFVEKLRLLYGP